MTPIDPETLKMAQRSQMRLAQAFQLFMVQIAHGASPQAAIQGIDAAMDAWTDYEDAHAIEMPRPQFTVEKMLERFAEMADRLANPQPEWEDCREGPDLSMYFVFGPEAMVCKNGSGGFAYVTYEEIERQRSISLQNESSRASEATVAVASMTQQPKGGQSE